MIRRTLVSDRGGKRLLTSLDRTWEDRMTRRYPKWWRVVQAEPPVWVCQYDAARELGIHILRIGILIGNDHLEPAETALREMGMTRDSLDQERRWRSEAPLLRRAIRPLRDAINWI